MPWLIQMLGFGLLLLGIAFALYVSLWLLVILFVIGFGMVLWSHLRDFLIAKGILNPTFGVAPEESENITIVEGDFERVSTKIQSDVESKAP